MIELNNSIFYKVKFNIDALEENCDLIWKVIYHIKTWLLRKYNKKTETISSRNTVWGRLKKGATLRSFDRRTIFIETESFEEAPNMNFWACRISEQQAPQAGYAPREWITEVGIKPIQKGRVEFSCVISYLDRPGFIGICENEPFPNVPNLIKYILQDEGCSCTLGDEKISIEPQLLRPGEWLPFWENVQRPERVLPYIFVSVKDEEHSDFATVSETIDPQQLAIAAGGNAKVFYAKDSSVLEEMDFYCPQEYKCYNGALRIYQPQMNLEDALDHRRHRYIGANLISELGQDKVIQMIRRALAQDVHFYESFFRVKDCRLKQEAHSRQLRLIELKRHHEEESMQITQEKEEQTEYWCGVALVEEEKRLRAEEEWEHLSVDMQAIRDECYRLSAEIESYRPLQAKNAELERACSNRLNTKTYPASPLDIINYFDAAFSDCIAFSEDVAKSVKDCTIPPDELWSNLFHLATTMRELYMFCHGDIYREFRNRTGISLGRGEGANTHQNKKLMRQYETEYHGIIIDIEAHIKCSRNYQRIHFGFCQEEQKVIVGWCGAHKDNATTQRVK